MATEFILLFLDCYTILYLLSDWHLMIQVFFTLRIDYMFERFLVHSQSVVLLISSIQKGVWIGKGICLVFEGWIQTFLFFRFASLLEIQCS